MLPRVQRSVKLPASLANRGAGLERVLADLHAVYEAQDRASIIRLPTPYKVLRPGTPPTLIVVPAHKGEPDYALQVGGLAILMDAKECAADRWPLAHLPDHQAVRFDRHIAQGGAAFVLLYMGGVHYLMPWGAPVGALAWYWREWNAGKAKRGNAALDAESCAKLGKRLPSCDWLSTAVEMSRRTP